MDPKTNTLLQTVNDRLETLRETLAAGHSERLQAYLKTVSKFHRYSFHNQMLIWAQRPDASRVAGFKTWQALGRQVRKGERGIRILAPRTFEKTRPDGSRDRGVYFVSVAVFDVSQTDGAELPTLAMASGEPGRYLPALETAAREAGIVVTYVPGLAEFGSSAGGRIEVRADMPPAETLATLAHELAHELLHHEPGQRITRGRAELEAEAVAYVVTCAAGCEPAGSADYIGLYGGDAEALADSLQRIRATAATLLRAVREV